jgi:hypothetical protein
VVARYRGQDLRRLLRGDGAFALPDVYEYLEAESFRYAIRLAANSVLQERIAPLLNLENRHTSHHHDTTRDSLQGFLTLLPGIGQMKMHFA